MKYYKIIPFSWLTSCFSLVVSNICYTALSPQCKGGLPCSETPQTGSCHQPSPRTKQSVHTSSLVGQAWHRALRRWRTSAGQRRGGTADKNSEQESTKRMRPMEGWEENGRIICQSIPHFWCSAHKRSSRSRWWLLGPPVCLSFCLGRHTCMSVFLCACRVDAVHLLCGTGLSAVSLTFSASLVFFPSHVEP